VPRVCFIGHKAESLNCQVGSDITASTTKAIFNLPHPRIVRFMQGEILAVSLLSVVRYKHSSVPPERSNIYARQGKISLARLYY
jgi:hypothetical protein